MSCADSEWAWEDVMVFCGWFVGCLRLWCVELGWSFVPGVPRLFYAHGPGFVVLDLGAV